MKEYKVKLTFLISSLCWCICGDLSKDFSYHRHFPLLKYKKAKKEKERLIKEIIYNLNK